MVRRAISALLVVLAAVLTPIALTSVWTRDVVTDTDSYVSATAPLAEQPAVQRAIEDRVARAVVQQLAIGRRTQVFAQAIGSAGLQQFLEEQGATTATAVRAFVRDAVRSAVASVVESDAFPPLWKAANRAMHRQLVEVLSSDVGSRTVTLDLRSIAAEVFSALDDQGLPVPSADALPRQATFQLANSSDLDRARVAYRGVDAAGLALPVLALLAIAGALLLSTSRRRTALVLGVLAALALAAEAVLVLAARTVVTDSPDSRNGKAVIRAGWDAVTAGLWHLLIAGFVVALLVAAISALAPRLRRGPSA